VGRGRGKGGGRGIRSEREVAELQKKSEDISAFE
jgi:hypothetical protein